MHMRVRSGLARRRPASKKADYMSAHRIAWGLGSGLLACSLLACSAQLAGSGSELAEPDAGPSMALDGEARPAPTGEDARTTSDAAADASPEALLPDGSQLTGLDAALALDAANDAGLSSDAGADAGADIADGAVRDAQGADAIV